MEVVVTQCFAYDAILYEIYSKSGKGVYFDIDHFVGKSEFRDSVFQYAAYFMQGFKYGYIITAFYHVTCK